MILAHDPTFTAGQTVLTFPERPMVPHDHKGHSEEKCHRCGWVMGHPPLNCNNDDTPHLFPSQTGEPCLRPLAPGDRVAIAVPCEACAGRGYDARRHTKVSNDSQGTYTHPDCSDCHGLGSLIVASGTVTGLFLTAELGVVVFDFTDTVTGTLPTTVRCPVCWGAGAIDTGTSDPIGDGDGDPFVGCDQCNTDGSCPPIPVRATPGLQEVEL